MYAGFWTNHTKSIKILNPKLKLPKNRLKLSQKMAVFDWFFKFGAFFQTVLIIFNPTNLYDSESPTYNLHISPHAEVWTCTGRLKLILATRETKLFMSTWIVSYLSHHFLIFCLKWNKNEINFFPSIFHLDFLIYCIKSLSLPYQLKLEIYKANLVLLLRYCTQTMLIHQGTPKKHFCPGKKSH